MNFEDLVYVTGPFIRNFFFGILLRVIFEGIQLLADRFILQPLIGPNLPNPAPAAWNCHPISRRNPTIFAVHCSKTKVIDLSVASTETKYIKLKTKTQNNIVIFGIFHKKLYYYFGFFWNNLTKIPVFTKKLFWVLVFGIMNLVSVDAKERS